MGGLHHIISAVKSHSLRHKALGNLEGIVAGIFRIGTDGTVKSKDIPACRISYSENGAGVQFIFCFMFQYTGKDQVGILQMRRIFKFRRKTVGKVYNCKSSLG